MTDSLDRITTEYIDAEDRIRLSGQYADGAAVVIWLTRRLIQRLVPVLLEWLQQQHRQDVAISHAEIMQGWAQQAARAELTAQPPVQALAASSAWLADSIDFTHSPEGVVLTFKSANDQRAMLTLPAAALRQWLNIVYDVYVRADWSLAVCPSGSAKQRCRFKLRRW